MKEISNALQQFLLSNTVFNRAYLITITLPNGQVLNVLDGSNTDFIVTKKNVNAGALIGGWADAIGQLVASPFQVGNSWSEMCPQGATQLLLGVADTKIWNDNGGSWVMNLSPGGPTVTIPGTSQPWNILSSSGASINVQYAFDNSGGPGTAPISVAATVGTVYTLTYSSGTVSRKPGTFGAFDANGDPGNPGPGIASSTGWPGFWFLGTFDGPTTFFNAQLGTWERGAYTNEATFKLQTGSWELSAYVPASVLYPGTSTPLMQAIMQGAFNGATVLVQTLYWAAGLAPSTGFSMGTMQLTSGQIGNAKPTGRSKVVFEVFDFTYQLNKPIPPHYIQSSCRHSLFDAGCTLSVTNFISTSVTLGASTTNLYLNLTLPARANSTGYSIGNPILVGGIIYVATTNGTSAGSSPSFNTAVGSITNDGSVHWRSMNQLYPLGYITFMTGQNSGLSASIKAQTLVSGVVQLQLIKPTIFPVNVGDTIKLIPGCDKTMPTCTNVYGNLIHFGGQPFVPNPEIAQ